MDKNKEKPWYLYILECADRTYYTGITNDIKRRLDMHNSGKASRYTRARRPVRLILKKKCRDRSDALKREYAMKQYSREEKEGYVKDHAGRRSR